jgi:hypothetical protein
MCAVAPMAIVAVLGPRSCGKTALLKEVLSDKPYTVYINCRGISASTPASFVQALLTNVLPKAPMSVQEIVMNSLQAVVGGLATKVSMASDVKEDFTFKPAELVRLIAGIHRKTPAAGMNAFFDALRYVTGNLLCLHMPAATGCCYKVLLYGAAIDCCSACILSCCSEYGLLFLRAVYVGMCWHTDTFCCTLLLHMG